MPRLIICRGLPGAGKTHRAKQWVAEDPAARARVNRDDLRKMIHDGEWRGHDTESQIVVARDAAIRSLLRRGIDVVCDDTNLSQRVTRDVARVGYLTGSAVEVWDMTDVPLADCLERDVGRQAPVGDAVITDMYTRYLKGKSYPLPLPLPDEEDTRGNIYIPVEGGEAAIIVDIDGTVALKGTRSPYDESRVHEDRPNQGVIDAIWAMATVGVKVIFVSGRTDACREATQKWIDTNVRVPTEHLFMRASGDRRNDSIVKMEIFDQEIRDTYDIICIFDDRQRVVDMWRSLGLTVMQVAPGNF